MQVEKLFHKCGYPVLVLKKPIGLTTEILILDGNNPFVERKDGNKSPNLMKECPDCGGFIKLEKLVSTKPEATVDKGPSGYIPARI